MSISDKLTTIAENQQKVFDAGKKKQYDDFWDEFQDYGKRVCYRNAFYGSMDGTHLYGWNDLTYNPKYPIKVTPVYINSLFYYNTAITNTKVEIEINGDGTVTDVFGRCYKLETIPLLRLIGNHTFSNPFYRCDNLKNITIEGEITGSIDFQYSPLSKASIVSIIEHLSDTASSKSLTLKKSAVNTAFGINVDDESTYPQGSEYYVLRHSKDNWTFTYA